MSALIVGATCVAPSMAAAQDAPAATGSPTAKPPAEPAPPAQPAAPLQQPPVPPRDVYVGRPAPTPTTPKYSLWAGGRVGLIGFDDDFYENDRNNPETTGNFVKTGLSLEADVGVRLARRYIPYVGFELGLHPAGHRFDGESAQAYSTFVGIGFRSVWIDFAESAGFLTDLSFGLRTVGVSSGGQVYKMTSLELFRLGLGVELRMSPIFTLSPMLTLSGGAMNDSSGSVNYGPGQGDGLTHPTYQNGAPIDSQRGYIVVGLGCGGHFDLFAKYK